MYAGGYGFNPNAQPQQQQQQQQQPQQPGGQPNQQMMFNQQQQFANMPPQGGFNPGANPQMMQGMPGGMMQNPGMPNMPPNGQMPGYPQQFPGGPYGQMMPGGVAPQNFAPNNYMMAGGMQGFPMNQPGMTPQQAQMMQRMQAQQAAQQAQQQHQQQQQQQQHQQQQQQHQQQQPHHQQQPQQQQHAQPQPQQQQQQPQPQQQQQQQPPQQHPNPNMNQVSTPQRPQSAQQGTPNPMQQQHQQAQQAQQQQGQISTPQPPSHVQTPQGGQQQAGGLGTPQTPTFAANQGPNASLNTPLSPGTESREKERFALLLDINHELLYESIQIQTTQQELKKENPPASGNLADRKPTEEENLFQQDYLQCMRRLQANLSYMAALADRKPEVKAPPCPAYLSAPPLNLTLKPRATPMGAEGQDSSIDPVADRAERDQSIKELYKRLQAVFPGFDPKKEPAFRMPGAGQKAGGPGQNQASPTVQQNAQMPNMTAAAGQ